MTGSEQPRGDDPQPGIGFCMACRLSLFGPPRLLDERGKLIPVPAKTFALVAYLALASGGAPAARASLRQFLWENSDSKTAATNLRKFLLRIRQRQREFGFELVHEERNHVRLAPDATIDLVQFLEIVAAKGSGDLVALCDIYRGDLLEGLLLEEPEAREWVQVQRTKLREVFISAVASRLEAAPPNTDRMLLRVAARRLIDVDSYNETGHRTLMRLFAEEGEPARVREIYTNLQQRLRDELRVEPDKATRALYQSLLPPSAAAAPEEPDPSVPPMPRAASQDEESADDATVDLVVAKPGRTGVPKVTVLPPPPVAEQSYHHHIAASLVEDIAIGLCRFRGLSVVAPHTAALLSQNGKKALFRTFGIDYALETQLQDRGGEVWLAAKLLNARSRKILWADQFEFSREAIARQYRELSVRIVLLLVDRIERTELARYDVEQDATAYHLFLKGQRYLRVLDLPNVRRARREFKAAVSACPDFVPAISGLAHVCNMEWLLMARGDSELLGEAERLSRRSLEIDPDDARGYRDLGLCTIYGGRFDESLEAFSQGERRNPQYADLLAEYADALQHSSDASAALEMINRAIELNPLGPDRYWWVAGGANFHLQRYREAIESMSRMRDQSPAFRLMAASWALLGESEKAAECVRRATDIHPDFNVESWLAILPIRDRTFAQHYERGLREAGFK